MPHCQKEQESSAEVHAELVRRCTELVREDADLGPTCVSVPSTWPAFHLKPGRCRRAVGGLSPLEREFGHIHAKYMGEVDPSGLNRRFPEWQGGGLGSMHVSLCDADAEIVLRLGWGERHLLAGKGAPLGLLLIYAPRTAAEVGVSVAILRAAMEHAKSL